MFMNRSHFYMKLVTFYRNINGDDIFAGESQDEIEFEVETLCIMGGFTALLDIAK